LQDLSRSRFCNGLQLTRPLADGASCATAATLAPGEEIEITFAAGPRPARVARRRRRRTPDAGYAWLTRRRARPSAASKALHKYG